MQTANKWILIVSLLSPLDISAQAQTYFKFSAGQSYSQIGQTQVIHFNPVYWKKEIAENNDVSPIIIGLSVGERIAFWEDTEVEIGLGYNQLQSQALEGKVYQYSLPQFYNLNYQYSFINRSFALEGKLLTYYRVFHPYISTSIGFNCNTSYGYREIPKETFAVPDPSFGSATQYSLYYAFGLGFDLDLAKNWRAGVGYRFSYLGKSKLGKSRTQITSDRIDTGTINANQFFLELIYAV